MKYKKRGLKYRIRFQVTKKDQKINTLVEGKKNSLPTTFDVVLNFNFSIQSVQNIQK